MLKIFETEEELAKTVATEMLAQLKEEAQPTFCLAAGGTTSSALQMFAAQAKDLPELSKFNFVSLDEWVGVPSDMIGTCYQMLNDDLFKRLPLKDNQVTFFQTKDRELSLECAKLDKVIAQSPITYSLMGVGMNGHIGLNEPGMPILAQASLVELSETTKRVMQKYFTEEVNLQQGISLGLGQLVKSKRMVVALIGEHKAEIAKKILEEPEANLPAQYFLNREHVDFYLDQAAASQLNYTILPAKRTLQR
ncbi:MAG: 6-phosphogluconolactonase [Streptococcaceae bacterium]|jgi:6-phosphogluconolactonase/glucosamine-6-phosphate isomerase/deaminase|nr:6-phosphogluconolactonase [Streptococcaceae bacterium]